MNDGKPHHLQAVTGRLAQESAHQVNGQISDQRPIQRSPGPALPLPELAQQPDAQETRSNQLVGQAQPEVKLAVIRAADKGKVNNDQE